MRNPLAAKRLVICAGPGGVGKTTTAAALAVAAARSRLRVVVATIDPAPRLIDALALPSLAAAPSALPAAIAQKLGVPPDSVFACRIDTASAFAALVSEFVSDPGHQARILANTIYKQITTTLTGAQEYAAALSLKALAEDQRFDLVVLDTPPAANALEFFDAPTRLAAAIESPLIRWLVPQQGGSKLLNAGRLSSGGGVVLRALSKLVGSQFLADLGTFLADFQPVLGGLSKRTHEVEALLKGPASAVVVVCLPEPQAMDEAITFSGKLASLGVPPVAFIVNRMMVAPRLHTAEAIADALRAVPHLIAKVPDLEKAATTLAEANQTVAVLATQHARQRDRLVAAFPSSAVGSVALLESTDDALDLLNKTAEALGAKGLTPASLVFKDAF